MLTKVQKYIIEDVCSIQHTSLIYILTKSELGCDKEGNKWEDILVDFELGRKDLDEQVIKVLGRFKEIKIKPDELRKANEYELSVFLKILVDFKDKWYKKYPKGYLNLLNKVSLWLDYVGVKSDT